MIIRNTYGCESQKCLFYETQGDKIMDKDLQLYSFIIDEDSVDEVELFAYKLPNELIQIIENITKEKNNSLSSSTIYKLATAIFEDVIHCNNTIYDINNDENRWVYSLKSIDIELFKEKVNDWLFKEVEIKGIKEKDIDFEDDLEYELISLKDILKNKHRNVYSIIPQYYIYKLSKHEFLYNTLNQKLKFYRVVGETRIAEMFTLPQDLSVNDVTEKKKYRDMLSYVISAKLKNPIDIEENKYVLNFSLGTRIWNMYPIICFKKKEDKSGYEVRSSLTNKSTSVYLYKKNQYTDNDEIIFNKISVQRDQSDSYKFSNLCDKFFIDIMDIDFKKILFNQVEYRTINNDQEVIALFIKKNTDNKDVEYGAGLPERNEMLMIINNILDKLKLREPIKFLRKPGSSKLHPFTTTDAKKYNAEKYIPQVEKDGLLKDSSKDLSEQAYKLNTHEKLLIHICTQKEEMIEMIIAATRILLRLENCKTNNIYSNSDGLQVEFNVMDNKFADCLQESETAKLRMQKIKELFNYDSQMLQGAIIDIPRYDLNEKEKDKDSKYIVRNALKECKIISQFINFIPTEEAEKSEKIKATGIDNIFSTVKDLISACGFIEGDLYEHTEIEEQDIILGIGKISTNNNENRIAMSKIDSGILYYKIYPETKWKESKELLYSITNNVLNETNIKTTNKGERIAKIKDINDWILNSIDRVLKEKRPTYCFVDCDVRTLWPIMRNSDFLNVKDISITNMKYLRIIRFSTNDEVPDYFVYDEKNNNINRKTGIFKSCNSTYYLVGEKHDGNRVKNDATKLSKLRKPIKRQTLCEVNIQGTNSEEEKDHIALITQKLRSMNISYKRDSSEPLPIYCLNRIGEYMISLLQAK